MNEQGGHGFDLNIGMGISGNRLTEAFQNGKTSQNFLNKNITLSQFGAYNHWIGMVEMSKH